MDTTHQDLDVTAITPAGNEYQLAVYVDPFPGELGQVRKYEVCGKCRGDGVVHYGNITLATRHASGRVCFQCMGSGRTSYLVSSRRQTVRDQVKAENERRAAAADYAATADERALEEYVAAWDEAHAEQDRRAALTAGYLGEVGERLRGLTATVEVNAKFETESFNGSGVDYKSMLILREAATGKIIKTVVGARGLERGDTVTISGTVKDHGNYQGQDQTVLGRAIIK